MASVKTPTSSLSPVELLISMIRYRTEVYFRQHGNTRERSTTLRSPIARLPPELLYIITSYLFYDIDALLACSLTCYSWFCVTLPHLHYYLTANNVSTPESVYEWPKPLRRSNKLGLLPFVRQLCIRNTVTFTPKELRGSNLRYFSALTNLQELGIDHLQVSSFMPNIQRYFEHLAPNLRFLALKEPKGSCSQILYFIGLFRNLQDLKLCYQSPLEEEEDTDESTLIPPNVPPLHGRLTLVCFTRERLVKDMITLFGGLRFRYMDLFRVSCVRLLLKACEETLETLRLYPTDRYEDNDAVRRDFDLSKNRSLRTLETTATSITDAGDAASGLLKTILSTIPPSLPLDVIIIHKEYEVGLFGRYRWTESVHPVPSCKQEDIKRAHFDRFMVFREMYSVREFRLVLCADVLACAEKPAMKMLDGIVTEATRRNGGFGFFRRGVLAVYDRRAPSIRFQGASAGGTGLWPIHVSAL